MSLPLASQEPPSEGLSPEALTHWLRQLTQAQAEMVAILHERDHKIGGLVAEGAKEAFSSVLTDPEVLGKAVTIVVDLGRERAKSELGGWVFGRIWNAAKTLGLTLLVAYLIVKVFGWDVAALLGKWATSKGP